MADTLALEKAYDDVTARFASEGTLVESAFGWREPARNLVSRARLVWVPGNRNGIAGKVMPARNPGRNPRPIATLAEYFHVWISASDYDGAEVERRQYKVVRLLRDAWHRAMYLSARGTFAIESEEWLTERKERRFGAALVITCTIEAMIPDAPLASAPVDSAAVIATSQLDVTEVDTFTAADAP
jgi:hypothetical protein